MLKVLLVIPFLIGTLAAKNTQTPINQVEACKRFSPAIVGIQAYMNGTGFIVSQDGWILTAAHLVIDPVTRQNHGAIRVFMPDGTMQPAVQVAPIDDALSHDFALLKVDKANLTYLELGNENDAPIGSDITIIGFPLSTGVTMKFCLSGSIVASASSAEGAAQFNIIFFQGVSIKGISGAPLISRETGKIIGIENVSLAGIGPTLQQTKRELASGKGSGVSISGVDFGPVLYNLVDRLDTQIANGLGGGNGISSAKLALQKARTDYDKSAQKH